MTLLKFLFYFPIIMAVGDFIAAAGYVILGDWPRVGYWSAAGVLTVCTILMR